MLQINQLNLQLPHYRKWWRREWATCIEDVTFDVQPAEIHAVIGASGAGKSLLASTIMGLLPEGAKATGQLYFDGNLLTSEHQQRLRGRQLALIPQSLNALDPLVRSQRQVSWAARRVGNPHTVAWQLAREALSHYQLDRDAQRRYPHELSGGMARRVLTAMAHVSRANLIIADEPSVGLDPQQRNRVLAALKALALEGKAVILITHDLRHALPIADRVTLMRQGRSVETTQASAFQGQGEQLQSTYARALWQALPNNAFSTSPTCLSPKEPTLA
jgi:peptide/nickel transport system ATP-binding protein